MGTDRINRLIKEQGLVEDISERELNNPESVVIDLRLNKLYRLEGKAFLGVAERETPKAEAVARYDPNWRSSYVIKPGEYLIAETIEKVNIPKDIFVVLKPRTTLHRMGIMLRGSIIDPGYSGILHPALFNAGSVEVEIEMGARFCQLFFMAVEGNSTLYRGQWQGGRVTTEKREEQV